MKTMKKLYICPQIEAVRMCVVTSFATSPSNSNSMHYSPEQQATNDMVMEAKSRDDESDWSSLDPMFEW